MKLRTFGRGMHAAGLLAALTCLGLGPTQPGAQPVHPKLDQYAAIAGAEKLDQSLLAAAETAEKQAGGLLASALPAHFSRTDTKAGPAALLEIGVKKVDGAVLGAVEAAGADVLHASVAQQRLTVSVLTSDSLPALAAIGEVLWVSPLVPPVRNVVGYGGEEPTTVAGMNLGPGISFFGLDGEGQRVGIISDSFARTAGVRGPATTPGPGGTGILQDALNQIAGFLPSGDSEEGDEPFVLILNDSLASGAIDEGAAMAELVHSIAPGASILFHAAGQSPAAMADAINALSENGATVIVDDIGFLNEPVYQVGLIANAAEGAVNAGIPYFAAMGNQGDAGMRFQYRSVSGSSDTAFPASGNDLHRWGDSGPKRNGFLPVYMEPGSGFTAIVQWNQPWESLNPVSGAEIDLDVYVTLTPDKAGINEAATPAAAQQGRISFSRQGITSIPQGDAIEIVSYTNNTGFPRTVYLAVDHFWGSQSTIPQMPGVPLEVSVVFLKDSGVEVDSDLRGVSLFSHMWHPAIMSTAAVNWIDTPWFDTSFGPTPFIDPEDFTTRGGSLSGYFSVSGVPGIITAVKPDFSAVNGNNTSFFGGSDFDLSGYPNFFGTSAAAPNAAAVGALLRQLNPQITPAQIRTALVETAVDVLGERAAPGRDDVSGAGLIDGTAAILYVADNYGADVGGPESPNSRLFDFAVQDGFDGETPIFVPDAQGWTAEAPPGFTSPEFDLQLGNYRMTNPNTVNTLGWLKSPEMIATSVDMDPDNPPFAINGGSGPDSVYRATWRVNANTASGADVPSFRMRASSRDFEESQMLVITSGNAGEVSPSIGDSRAYRQYFQLPATRNRFHLYFDVVSVDPWDAEGVGLGVEEVVLQAFDRNALAGQRLEQPLTLFQGNSRGWTPRSGSPLANAGAQAASDGLRLGPSSTGSETAFRFWGSPESSPAFALEVNRLYEASFSITSDAPASKRNQLPTFRLRANDGSNQMAVIVDVNSPGTGSNVPVAGEKKTYRMFFETIPDLAGNPVNFSFDYLFTPDTGNDPSLTVTLESMVVRSYLAPL